MCEFPLVSPGFVHLCHTSVYIFTLSHCTADATTSDNSIVVFPKIQAKEGSIP